MTTRVVGEKKKGHALPSDRVIMLGQVLSPAIPIGWLSYSYKFVTRFLQ